MSDQPGQESREDDLGSYSVDDEDQLQPEDTLVGGGDPLDEGYSPPDRLHGSLAFGTTAEEQAQEETIEQRIRQEVPEEGTAYGAPDNESGLDGSGVDGADMVGGDDPDAIPAEQDYLDSGTGAIGQLVAPDEGAHEDTEQDLVADAQEGVGGESAEEAAMHVVDVEDERYQDG